MPEISARSELEEAGHGLVRNIEGVGSCGLNDDKILNARRHQREPQELPLKIEKCGANTVYLEFAIHEIQFIGDGELAGADAEAFAAHDHFDDVLLRFDIETGRAHDAFDRNKLAILRSAEKLIGRDGDWFG
jgi:hypothetical protein